MAIRRAARPVLVGGLAALTMLTSSYSAGAACGDGVFDDADEECDVADPRVVSSCTEACRFACTTNVHEELTDHTCLHVTNGPFQATFADAYPGAAPRASIGQGHVFYTVTMATNEAGEVVDSAIHLTPFGSADVAIYLNESELVTLRDSQGETVPALFEGTVDSCSSGLERVLVYALDMAESYLLVFPPEGPAQRSLVFENATGKKYDYSRDDDGDGFGQPQYALRTWCKVDSLGFVRNTDDCDDTRASVHPEAPELCDELDNDCDGSSEGADEQCQPAAEPDATSGPGEGAASERDAQTPLVVESEAGVANETNGTPGLPDGETRARPALTETGREETTTIVEQSPSGVAQPDAGAVRAPRDASAEESSSRVNGRPVGARSGGGGCTVAEGAAGRNARAFEALLALVVLSCALRRRVGAGPRELRPV